MTIGDLDKLKELHERYHKEDFSPPEFFGPSVLNAFTIRDSEGDILVGASVTKIAEISLVLNRDKNKFRLSKALLETLNIALYTCEMNQIDWLHAFIKDKDYERQLRRLDFHPRCQALSRQV